MKMETKSDPYQIGKKSRNNKIYVPKHTEFYQKSEAKTVEFVQDDVKQDHFVNLKIDKQRVDTGDKNMDSQDECTDQSTLAEHIKSISS